MSSEKMKVISCRVMKKGESSIVFFSLALSSGMTLHSCTYNVRKDGAKWIGLPSRSYEQNGETKWKRLVDFKNKGTYLKFQAEAKAAVDSYFKEHPELNTKPEPVNAHGVAVTDENIPF